jgi:hypothetical protein
MRGLVDKRLFKHIYAFDVAADLETNLLYLVAHHKKIFVGNEQGEVLYHFLCDHAASESIFVSCNIILTTYYGSFVLYNEGGKFMTQVKDIHIHNFSNICLVHNLGVVVLASRIRNEINFWRLV